MLNILLYMTTKELTVEVENESIDLEELDSKYELTVKVAPESEPITSEVGTLISID